jgi:polyisoprenoid-binding protein YceI
MIRGIEFMVRRRLLLIAVLPLLAALTLTSLAAEEVAPGQYQVVAERSLARLTVESPVGRVRARLPFRDGAMTVGEDGRILSASAVLAASAIAASRGSVKTLLTRETGLDVARFPVIRFAGSGGRVEDDKIVIEGELTVKETARPVRFEGEVVRSGPRRFAAVLTAEIDRTAFGVTVGRPIYSRFATIRLRLVMIRPRTR